MKTFKLFSIVLLIHLFAVPLVLIQLGSRSSKSIEDAEPLEEENIESAEAPKPKPPTGLQELSEEEIAALARQNSPVLHEMQTHVVRSGESPSVIATRYGMRTRDLMKINNIADASKLQVGAKLQVYAQNTN
jgi:LysM repeat protein